ncbi:YkvA family protein [Peribacillus sp. SCS-37]|uniref:YkvA family protein n=1 Tax=Paraperibacillus esterisolvens TaxID=3115296 RepID=UPI003906937F
MLRKWFFTKIAYRLFRIQAGKMAGDKGRSRTLLKRAAGKAAKNETALKGVWKRLQLLMEMAKSWAAGDYRRIPYRSLIIILVGIIYFVSPLDFIPDFLLGFGMMDDIAVLGFVLSQLDYDIEQYLEWKITGREKTAVKL